MDKKTKQKISSRREALKYSAERAYFGKLTGKGLSSAYGMFKHTQDWDKPITSSRVVVGHIDGGVICRALWNEMSYNPVRFGVVSPFVYKGREDIYHFCRSDFSSDTPGFEVIEKIRHKLIDFMMLNGKAQGQWCDKIDAKSGIVTIQLVDGHSDDKYKSLSMLREMIRIVASQNLEDFKHKPYRTQMLKVINSRHPHGVRANGVDESDKKLQNMQSVPLSLMEEETAEDRLDRFEETAQINVETSQYRPYDQRAQGIADLELVAMTKLKQNTK